jgi:glycosyltransferase involved in cell wall biosynthesis
MMRNPKQTSRQVYLYLCGFVLVVLVCCLSIAPQFISSFHILSPNVASEEGRTGSKIIPSRDASKTCVCTISSWNNYGFVKVFFDSVEAVDPELTPVWVVADNPQNPDPDVATIRKTLPRRWVMVYVSDLVDHLGGASVEELALRYGVAEFNTAIKPAAFLYLFQKRGMQRALFFDNDIWVMRSLGPLVEKLSKVDFVFTPHIVEPYPLDGKRQDERNIMLAGQMNLGFCGVANTKRSLQILRWWGERLRYYGFAKPDLGMHFDQNWISMVFSYLDQSEYIIERDSIWNIAYWNLHYTAAHLSRSSDGHYLYDGRRVGFVHFSGMSDFVHYAIESVSPHQNRLKMSDLSPVTRQLFSDYLDRLTANSVNTLRWRHIIYGFPTLPDQLKPHWNEMHDPMNHNDERSVRLRTLAKSGFKPVPPRNETARMDFDVFPEGIGEYFLEGVHDQVVDGVAGWLPEVVYQFYNSRVDVQAAYPDVLGKHRLSVLDWFTGTGYQEFNLPVSWAAAVKKARRLNEQKVRDTRRLAFGVNLLGWFAGSFGVAESARLVWSAVSAAGLDKEAIFLPRRVASLHTGWDYDSAPNISRAGDLYFNIVVANADFSDEWLDRLYPDADWKRHFNIGYWAWELQDFPMKWAAAAKRFNEIWTPSDFITQAVKNTLMMNSVAIPVKTIPFSLTVSPEIRREERRRKSYSDPIAAADGMFDIPPHTLSFLVQFDFLSCFQRKNVMAAVYAFRAAFQDVLSKSARGTKNVLMVVKVNNAQVMPQFEQELRRLRDATGGYANIRVIHSHFSSASWNALLWKFDVYVSLHRSEGFGLLLLRMMMMGKPVIATNYSGNVDFMVPYIPPAFQFTLVKWSYARVENVGEVFEHVYANSSWADPDVKAAAVAMRKFYDYPELLTYYRQQVMPVVKEQFSVPNIGNRIVKRLRTLYAAQG